MLSSLLIVCSGAFDYTRMGGLMFRFVSGFCFGSVYGLWFRPTPGEIISPNAKPET
jgi:hypothetical protein